MKHQTIRLILCLIASYSAICRLQSQENSQSHDFVEKIMFYNVENLYDPFNDSITDDDEFTSGELRRWNYDRYRKKLFSIARVIIAAGERRLPVIVGLCEVENRFVLNQLVNKSPLAEGKYSFVHRESPDPRGVDVALLYDSLRFKPTYTEFMQIIYQGDSSSRTREILYCCGSCSFTGRLHIFVNHWPSNYGGSASSDIRRNYVAKLLRSKLDSIFLSEPEARIVIMGDFNEGPGGDNLKLLCSSNKEDNRMINLSTDYPSFTGTHKYKGNWDILDHLIVSWPLVIVNSIKPEIFSPDFLLEPDEAYTGGKPFRTFSGPAYKGGFSDHLPVILYIEK